jgi:membrane protease YdiL (CAAX protease family)
MNEQPEPVPPVVALVESVPFVVLPARKGWTKLAWVAILGTVALIVGLRMLPASTLHRGESPAGAAIDLKVLRLQLQIYVAIQHWFPAKDGPDFLAMADAGGDPAKVLRVSAFADEIAGPKEALKQLDRLDNDPKRPLTPEEERLLALLRRLYRDQKGGAYQHPSVSDEEAERLKKQLGWFGALALYPAIPADEKQPHGPDPLGVHQREYEKGREAVLADANRTATIIGVYAGGVVILLFLGFMLLPLFLLLWLLGVIRVGLEPGIAHGGVYAETFAIWLGLYSGLLILSETLLHDTLDVVVRGCIAMPLSLLVVFWPVLRGVPWRRVRKDIGWNFGRQPLLEPACGWLCYLVNLPLVFAGFVVSLLLVAGYSQLQSRFAGPNAGEPAGPSHPVVEQFTHTDSGSLALFFLLLSVIAPLVEETMFRGILHRHLREIFFLRHPLIGGLCTALVVNFIFAVIHPQGWFFVPALMMLACGFSLAREWRGTLVPSMIAHGTHNFLIGLLGYFLLSG